MNKYIEVFREAVEKLEEYRNLDLDAEEDEKVNRDNIEMYRRKISTMSVQEKAKSLGIDKFLEQANKSLSQAIDVLDKQQDLYNTYSGPNAYF